jgi:hypothetical protein
MAAGGAPGAATVRCDGGASSSARCRGGSGAGATLAPTTSWRCAAVPRSAALPRPRRRRAPAALWHAPPAAGAGAAARASSSVRAANGGADGPGSGGGGGGDERGGDHDGSHGGGGEPAASRAAPLTATQRALFLLPGACLVRLRLPACLNPHAGNATQNGRSTRR